MKPGTLVRFVLLDEKILPPDGVSDGSIGIVLGFHLVAMAHGPFDVGFRPLSVAFGDAVVLVYEDELEVIP